MDKRCLAIDCERASICAPFLVCRRHGCASDPEGPELPSILMGIMAARADAGSDGCCSSTVPEVERHGRYIRFRVCRFGGRASRIGLCCSVKDAGHQTATPKHNFQDVHDSQDSCFG